MTTSELLSLLKGKYASLAINYNEHASSYMTAEEALECNYYPGDWVSAEEKEKSLKQNGIWSIHFYPDTPNGFYCILGSTLESIIEAALKEFGIKP